VHGVRLQALAANGTALAFPLWGADGSGLTPPMTANSLVNAFAAGLGRHRQDFLLRPLPASPKPCCVLGREKPSRDGVGGGDQWLRLEFDEHSYEDKTPRQTPPTVQVGDPL